MTVYCIKSAEAVTGGGSSGTIVFSHKRS